MSNIWKNLALPKMQMEANALKRFWLQISSANDCPII